MKRLFKLIAVVFCFFPIFVSAQFISLPQEVNDYYKTRNFVAAFSTLSERNALVGYDAVEELPSHLRSDRLREIFVQMQALKSRELAVDSGIMGSHIVVSGISQVEKVRQHSNGFLVVETLIYDLDKGINAILIALYEKGGQISLSKLQPQTGTISHRELHEWSKLNGHWFKKAVNVVLIEN
jgi:hypothetical protein